MKRRKQPPAQQAIALPLRDSGEMHGHGFEALRKYEAALEQAKRDGKEAGERGDGYEASPFDRSKNPLLARAWEQARFEAGAKRHNQDRGAAAG